MSPAAPAENLPLVFTINPGSDEIVCADTTADSTLEEVRNGILSGRFDLATQVRISETGNGKTREHSGSLLECARKYERLREVYEPVAQSAASGTRWGALTGAVLWMTMLGVSVARQDSVTGLCVLLYPAVAVIMVAVTRFKVQIPLAGQSLGLIVAVAPAFAAYRITSNAVVFGAVVGAVTGGVVLCCFPGRAIGAVLGVRRRQSMPLAPGAQVENALTAIGIPAVISVLLWLAYAVLLYESAARGLFR